MDRSVAYCSFAYTAALDKERKSRQGENVCLSENKNAVCQTKMESNFRSELMTH